MQHTQAEPFLNALRATLPEGWRVDLRPFPAGASRARDGYLSIVAPDGSEAVLVVEMKRRLSARGAAALGSDLSRPTSGRDADGTIVFTRYVSRLARERLRSSGICYLDLTGNVWISIRRPAVFVERQGADRDPDPPRRGVRSLKGAKAARIVRALADWRPPLGVREIARRTGTSPGYVTRVLALLEDEDVVRRDARGEVTEVRWQDLLRRWSVDYSVLNTNRPQPYIAPRGLPQLRERLGLLGDSYAVTGVFAVPPETQVAPGRALTCYMRVPEIGAEKLDLRPTETGANVLLLEPFDDVVFERVRDEGGVRAVALTQCVIDLLTGGGREPTQADELMRWMTQHEDAWRA